MTKNRLLKKLSVDFLAPEIVFLCFLRSGAFRKGPGPIPEAPGSLPDQILQRFCDIFLPVSPGSCRGLSGSAGMLPGYTASLRNSLCGVSLGYGDLAERIKFAVPHRGAGVLNPVRTPYRSPGELASPYLSAGLCGDRRSEPRSGSERLFSDFFRFFRCLKKRSKNGRSKNRLFPEILAILVPPTSIFSHFWFQNGSPEVTFSVFFSKR